MVSSGVWCILRLLDGEVHLKKRKKRDFQTRHSIDATHLEDCALESRTGVTLSFLKQVWIPASTRSHV